MEGRTLRLTGTAEEQYREWRQMLQQLYTETSGGALTVATPAPQAPSTATTTVSTEGPPQ